MSTGKEREIDRLHSQKRPELAILEVLGNVMRSNIEEWRTSRSLAVNLSETAFTLRSPDLATIEAYDRVPS